ncbi:MAG: alpha-isopropylmalate synthase regulatory domain-containing protein [Victivallaceae bacterium]|nr:alpha-isopropylmalate synthase regulatory domain-containing protein [Victivallaceae bacterium]
MMKNRKNEYVEVLDTTLRDGEQTPGVAFTPSEKLEIAKLLIGRVRVDRLELGSARVSDGEREAVKTILEWAEQHGSLDAMEILGFIDSGKSVDWIRGIGGRVVNLLAKGSEEHCRVQLRRTPQQHFDETLSEIAYAKSQGLSVNVYLEDWSRGMRDNLGYVYEFLKRLADQPVERIMLPDTLGVLTPQETFEFIGLVRRYFPEMRLDFHGHNDYGLVTANSLAAVMAGVSGVHTTINGLGERTGNQPLAQLAVVVNDMTDRRMRVVELELQHSSELVQNISGKRCGWNTPVVGADVFTQTCGVHADGDKKGGLYVNLLLPERFGRQRDYALGKLSGKASLEQNLDRIGVELSPDTRQKVLQEIIRLGDRKKNVAPSDLPFIIANVLRTPLASRLKVTDYEVMTCAGGSPRARVVVELDGRAIESRATGDGGYDAFVKALRKSLKQLGVAMPKLLDYQVRIPPGGKTDALVEATISWAGKDGVLVTTGVDPDQVAAAILATEKMLNLII